jgi:hypothetical protein
MKSYKELKESLSHDYVLQHLADKDINAHIKNGKVVVHPDDAAETRRHLKKIGHDHIRVTTKGADQVAESIEELDEIKLATVGKIIKHSPKIASAAIGAAVAAHSVDVPKQPVKASYSEFTKKIQKEEVESLDELSKKTLGSYVKQASQSAQALATTAMHQRHQSDAHYANGDKKKSAEFGKYSFDSTERQLKRHKGIKKAVDKLTKEEVESLDEGSFKYHMDKAVEADARGDTKKKEYHLANAKTARYAVPTSAYLKHKELFDKYKKMTEEVEQIDELSKKTLGSYIKKATGGLNGVAHHAFNANEKIGRDSDDRAKSYSKAVKRIKGVERATDKLTKEEVELTEGKIPVEHAANSVGKVLGQHNAVKFLAHLKPGTEKHTSWDKINTALKSQGVQTHHIAKIAGHIKPVQFKEEVESIDEISAKTLDSYRAKAFADNEPKNQEKRTKGRHLAFDKMVHKNAVKVPATNEEVELDEVLDPSMGAGEYVKDFQKSDAPQFKGKSQEKRRIMGIAAYMAAKREKNK